MIFKELSFYCSIKKLGESASADQRAAAAAEFPDALKKIMEIQNRFLHEYIFNRDET